MLNQPLMEKLVAMRWQGMVEGLKTQEQGVGAKTESGQAQRTGLRGRHRLPDGAWTGQVGGAGSGQRLCLGPQSREHLCDRTLRRGQELCRLGPGTESLSRWPLRSLSSRRCLAT